MPLPPYIGRAADASDRERYQTVFAREPGAVAAPTAGLHFTADPAGTRSGGVAIARLTLHVGAGTFQPLRSDDIAAHRMHSERFRVPATTVAAIEATRQRGGRVIAVGTTVVRALESAAATDGIAARGGDRHLHRAGPPLPRGRRAADELPPAGSRRC